MVILIAQNTGEDGQMAAGQIVPDILYQCFDTLGIVTAVGNKQRLSCHQFKASGPGYGL